MSKQDEYRQALSAVIGITVESLEGGGMSNKERKAKAILKLLEDIKWPDRVPGMLQTYGGLLLRDAPHNLPQTDEIYIGRYSPLADAIREWQHTKEEA